jgi:hypothetical protein
LRIGNETAQLGALRKRMIKSRTDLDVLARAIVERLQQANWLIQRGPPASLGATPASYGEKR